MGYWKASSHDLKAKGSGPSAVMVWCLEVQIGASVRNGRAVDWRTGSEILRMLNHHFFSEVLIGQYYYIEVHIFQL